ncbi:hypothetical protein ACLBXM_11360 [Xanthobacteraceae bacterium A53D]
MRQALPLALSLALGTVLLPGSAGAATVIDYAKASSRAVAAPARPDAAVLAALAQAPAALRNPLGAAPVSLGQASGAFTAPGAKEVAYLLSAGRPSPMGRDIIPQLVLVMAGETLAGAYALPPSAGYDALKGAVAGADGRRDLLLEGSFMNMGQSVVSLDVVRLGPDTATVQRTLKEVYFDGCDNPQGEREKRAATIRIGDDGKLSATWQQLTCDK